MVLYYGMVVGGQLAKAKCGHVEACWAGGDVGAGAGVELPARATTATCCFHFTKIEHFVRLVMNF